MPFVARQFMNLIPKDGILGSFCLRRLRSAFAQRKIVSVHLYLMTREGRSRGFQILVAGEYVSSTSLTSIHIKVRLIY